MDVTILLGRYGKTKHWEDYPPEYAKKFASFLKNKSFSGLLVDAGCGNGKDTSLFNSEGFDALGIDISEEEIKTAKATFPNCKFEVQDIENMTFKDEEVSAFFCVNTIYYTNQAKVFNEFLRTLKKGGYLFVHFSIEVQDEQGNVDFIQKEEEIMPLLSKFKIAHKEIVERTDMVPEKHYHKIMEFILQKPE